MVKEETGKNKILTLDKLKVRYQARILSIDCADKSLRKRILDMGLTPGVKLTLVKVAPMGDPIEVWVRGYELSLRREDASSIKVEEIGKASRSKVEVKSFNSSEHTSIGEYSPGKTQKKVKIPSTTKFKFALVGNQNSGKTTLFNRLTGANQHVGNFPGVTVEKTEGTLIQEPKVTLVDLPGIYSLSPYSKEEVLTEKFILEEKPDCIINIVDATNIERNLLLTTQLLELKIPMVIALNMMDEVSKNHGSIDINGLQNALGVPVVPISASKNQGIEELVTHALVVASYKEMPMIQDFCENTPGVAGSVHRCLHSICHLIQDKADEENLPVKFLATKLAEGDPLIVSKLGFIKSQLDTCEKIIAQMEEETGVDREVAITNMRFSFIDKVCSSCVIKPYENRGHRFSLKLDRILTGKYTALLSFSLIMLAIFYLTFGSVGAYLSDLLEGGIDFVTSQLDSFLSWYGLNPIVHSLIIDGVCAGVGSVLSFLPTIVVLFLFLSVLEDSGYMTRVAFFMDSLLRKIGLSGRSFVPMLIGFGCSVPAIMATRTLPSEKDRKLTIFLTPFMSCSAKLPIYALFTACFFSSYQVVVISSMYLIGILVGIVFAYIVKLFFAKGEAVPFVLELPNYRFPTATNVYKLIWTKSKAFITKAFTVIFYATILIWFLQSFDIRLNFVEDSSKSILALMGSWIAPVFSPMGMSDWRISTAFLTGFMAKESVVSTLSVLAGGADSIQTMFSPLAAFCFMVFSLLYTPCVAAISVVKKELGTRFMFLVILVQCLIAWLVSLAVFNIGSLFIK